MNLVKIANACAVECERQHVGLVELGYLLDAYNYLITQSKDDFFRFNETRFLILGGMIEPIKNQNGWRRTPVTFQNGGSSATPSEIPRLMINLRDMISDYKRIPDSGPTYETACEITREFLWIHPFKDGNGRLAFILFNYLLRALDEPLALPDFGWN